MALKPKKKGQTIVDWFGPSLGRKRPNWANRVVSGVYFGNEINACVRVWAVTGQTWGV
jgi:hypothetical protein